MAPTLTGMMSGWGVRRVRRRFPVGASPTRQTLQPEATGAATEVTNWLRPSECVSRIGDSASVQAATRVNAEHASKRTIRRPTRQPFRGRLIQPTPTVPTNGDWLSRRPHEVATDVAGLR